MNRIDLVRVFCHPLLGRPHTTNRLRFRPLVLGYNAISCCVAYCTWKGGPCIRVSTPRLLFCSVCSSEYFSLWTKYTVAGKSTRPLSIRPLTSTRSYTWVIRFYHAIPSALCRRCTRYRFLQRVQGYRPAIMDECSVLPCLAARADILPFP